MTTRPTSLMQPRRGPVTRMPIMPDHIRRLIPRDRDGREPCLRYLGGGMCCDGNMPITAASIVGSDSCPVSSKNS
ncbi:hypothetical protein PC119_g6923 [Phytophthora cactorum]|uniref:Uncharacterized protein n=1 Tax=Phytophthora cactorum TaxID=29920 RepID=A0A8T1DE16_9STRA|nr:hypothetical protein PC114_g11393 [Phytophthora cactorum]KAG2939198.1 hypothetical protein PC117_g11006 [Phytophthora cactorum]KAG2986992.1 hypothetical protein PC120_g23707 [Phytophthora cactorum]KAG3028661.1 hypothetical protein PC119_g6923 [Phytophthora cactorum]KAG3074337.1 hypothetical protein PC121_g8399 [Phytophthora cactorum]